MLPDVHEQEAAVTSLPFPQAMVSQYGKQIGQKRKMQASCA